MTTPRTALIIGASRGLGLGLTRQLRANGWQVTATVRDLQRAEALQQVPGVAIETLDIDDGSALHALASRLQGQVFDLLLVNAGIMGPADQSPAAVDAAALGQLFMTNALAPIRLAERLVGQVRPRTGILAFMSSVLGSVACPEGNDKALYKASKAALNSLTHSFFVEHLQDSGLTVLSLHPGWVKTDMGGDQAPLEIEPSCRGLVQQLEHHAGLGGHRFIDYQGQTLAW